MGVSLAHRVMYAKRGLRHTGPSRRAGTSNGRQLAKLTPSDTKKLLRGAQEWGRQVALHPDSLNEAGYLESTLVAIGERSIHAFYAEGAGGGRAPTSSRSPASR